MASNFQLAQQQYLDTNGKPVAGALLRFFDTTTTTLRPVYSDAALTTPIDQPIEADAAGRWPQIYVSTGVYKYRVSRLVGVVETTLEEIDPVDPSLSTNAGALSVASGGTGASTEAGAISNLGAYPETSGTALELRVDDVEAILDAPILAASNTQAYADPMTFVHTSFQTRDVTLTGNMTVNAPTVTAGQFICEIFKQDATGGRIISAWNAAYLWPANVKGVLSTTANAVDVLFGYARTTGLIEVLSFKRQDLLSDIAIVEENQTSATAGGTFTSGADRTRVLNTEVSDLAGLVTVASNQITITNAGTYEISWSAPAFRVDRHQSFLYNITSAAEVKRGSSEHAQDATAQTRSVGSAIVVLAASAVFEIRHRCTTTRATDGLGLAASFGTEIFTQVVIRKLP